MFQPIAILKFARTYLVLLAANSTVAHGLHLLYPTKS